MQTISAQTKQERHTRVLLRQCLGTCSAMNLDQIEQHLGLTRDHLLRELDALAAAGEVEVLSPLAHDADAATGFGFGRHTRHYRLVRPTDDQYLWEQEVTARLPAARMFDARQAEPATETRTGANGFPPFRTAAAFAFAAR